MVILAAFAVCGLVARDPGARGRRLVTLLAVVTVLYVVASQGLA